MEKFKMYAILFAIAIPLVGLVALLLEAGAPEGVCTVLLVGGLLAACIIYAVLKKAKQDKTASYDANNKTLLLHARCADSENFITVKEYKNPTFKYNPAELVYTSATVGGITTGGFHVNEAYYSISSMQKTGKYELHYKGDGYCLIETIKCDFPIDENSAVKKFKKDSTTLLLKSKGRKKKTEIEKSLIRENLPSAIRQGDMQTISRLTSEDIIDGKLSWADCSTIIAWIGGRLN